MGNRKQRGVALLRSSYGGQASGPPRRTGGLRVKKEEEMGKMLRGGGGGRKCGKQRTYGRGCLEVWQ